MSFLLDTDICSAYLKGDRSVWQQVMQYQGRLHTSAIVAFELYTWAFRAKSPPDRLQSLSDFLNDVTVLSLTHEVAIEAGTLRANLLDGGRPTPDMDLLIAATSLSHELTLVTHNVQDFAHIPDLTIEDWLR